MEQSTFVIETNPETLQIVFHPALDMPDFSRTLSDLANRITRMSGNDSEPIQNDGKGLPCKPAVTIRHAGCGSIHYMAIPEGRELPPFREMLNRFSPVDHQLSNELKSRLKVSDNEAEIMVMITPSCPHCPQAVRSCLALAFASPRISVAVIDAERFEDLTKQYNIRSVPMVIINRELMINRVPSPVELAEYMLSIHTNDYKKKVFLSLVESGNIDRAVKHLLSDSHGADHFFTVWEKSTLHLRMGLLYIAEQAIETHPSALDSIVPGLVKILMTEDTSLRGDTADLLGEIGHSLALSSLNRLLSDPNPDVAKIAGEALMKLNPRTV